MANEQEARDQVSMGLRRRILLDSANSSYFDLLWEHDRVIELVQAYRVREPFTTIILRDVPDETVKRLKKLGRVVI